MKFMVIAALALVSVSAHAINLKSCVVKNTPKNSKYSYERKVLLANGRGNYVQAGEMTNLRIYLASVGANADVYVNDQPQFIFKGDVTNGTYESAYDRGTIQCTAGKDVPFIYQTLPARITLGAGEMSGLAGCYVGDAQAAAADLAKMTNATAKFIDATTGTIMIQAIERQCIKGRGTNPDDYVCDKYGNVKAQYSVKNCDYDPEARP